MRGVRQGGWARAGDKWSMVGSTVSTSTKGKRDERAGQSGEGRWIGSRPEAKLQMKVAKDTDVAYRFWEGR